MFCLETKKKNYLIGAIFFMIINIPFAMLEFWIINLILTFISLVNCINFVLYDIKILNEQCDPKKFLEINKDNDKQAMNNCFAILHMYHKEDRELFEKYYEIAKNKPMQNDMYKMKLDYLLLTFKKLNGEDCNNEEKNFDENWSNNKYMSPRLKININKFLNHEKKPQCMLESVVKHFDMGVMYYNTQMYEQAKTEFIYVKNYGGTTIYSENASFYLNDLQRCLAFMPLKPDHISLKNQYLCYRNTIDAVFCGYVVLFILILMIGGAL